MTEPRILYKNERFLAVEKPAGMLTHAVRRHSEPREESRDPSSQAPQDDITLVDWIMRKFPEIKGVGDPAGKDIRPGIVHRLDRATSGILLVARTQEAFDYFKNLFKERKIEKTYFALVWGKPKKKEGVIEKPISLKPGTTKRTVHEGKEKRSAKTAYRVLKTFSLEDIKDMVGENPDGEQATLLEVRPLTGRTHQIRVHLASIGHPVVGDRKYGRKHERRNSTTRMYLHAFSLRLKDIDGTQLHLETEKPGFSY